MVRTNGQIKWKGNLIYLSHALRGEPVGLIQQSPAHWKIIYGPLCIGLLDEHTNKVFHTLPKCYQRARFRCYLCPRLHNGGDPP